MASSGVLADVGQLESSDVVVLPGWRPKTGDVPLPLVHLAKLHLSELSLLNVTFTDPDADVVPGVIGATSVPQPIAADMADRTLYAIRAGLVAGESATVVLSVEVQPDGLVGNVLVQVSSGNPSVDSEAAELARKMRWIPGTIERHAVPMRIRYSITLTAPA